MVVEAGAVPAVGDAVSEADTDGAAFTVTVALRLMGPPGPCAEMV
jgi:hypothetical protein